MINKVWLLLPFLLLGGCALRAEEAIERSWAIAIFVPPGYEQALPQFSATVYEQLTGEQ